jgi:hypothetical protein
VAPIRVRLELRRGTSRSRRFFGLLLLSSSDPRVWPECPTNASHTSRSRRPWIARARARNLPMVVCLIGAVSARAASGRLSAPDWGAPAPARRVARSRRRLLVSVRAACAQLARATAARTRKRSGSARALIRRASRLAYEKQKQVVVLVVVVASVGVAVMGVCVLCCFNVSAS